jgi:hypothetical protein
VAVVAVVQSQEPLELVEQVAAVTLEMVVEVDKEVEQTSVVGVAVLLLQAAYNQVETAVQA